VENTQQRQKTTTPPGKKQNHAIFWNLAKLLIFPKLGICWHAQCVNGPLMTHRQHIPQLNMQRATPPTNANQTCIGRETWTLSMIQKTDNDFMEHVSDRLTQIDRNQIDLSNHPIPKIQK